ncbi:hypothetical protein BDR26DRAFT_1008937 [Obelidium mucronatum]|nr:hypothetical protein BDR26DRAFT_1008937 [Obelidium mucronatum]
MARLQSICYSRAILQHGIELLVLCGGVRVRSIQWLETETTNESITVDCDGYVAGNAAVFIDAADFEQRNRRECALLSLYRLTDAVSRLQDINNHDSSRTSQGSLDYLDGYGPAVAPASLDLTVIKDYSRSVGCNDTYHSALLTLEESFTHIDRIVLASFEAVKQAKYFYVVVDHNSNFEANVKALADIAQLNTPVPNTPVVVTAAFGRNMLGFGALANFADAISSQTPDSFLKCADARFCVAEFFRSSPDSRPEFTLEISDRTTPVKKWMERKADMGAVFYYFDYNMNCQEQHPADMVGANVVVRFADKTTLRGTVSVEMVQGWPLKFVFWFEISKCSPVNFGWEHVYPTGYGGLRIEKQ